MHQEALVRMGIFGGIFLAMAAWEVAAPRRKLTQPKGLRWFSNFGLIILDSVMIRFLFPAASVGVAILAQERGWGLFNQINAPAGVKVLLSIVLLDLIIYFHPLGLKPSPSGDPFRI